ncbi:MAG TPA: tetratricopeptide repeat protein [Gemmatimonadaceae bacterium]|nr:tetratricopeptide repeat protein [Gemmatimonadaceae bacterium]
MNARHRQALSLAGLLAGFAASGQVAAVSAQGYNANRSPDPNTPRIMVPALKASGGDKNLGASAADAIRSRLSADVPFKQLWVIPKNDINATLEGSGFSTTEALTPNDARELAKNLRADQYLDGSVTKTPSGYRMETRLVLTRDNSVAQPLGVAEGGNLTSVATQVSKEVKEAMKQLDAEKKCVQAVRESKYQDAIAAANAGVGTYPKSVIARTCLLNAYVAMKAPSDSLLAVSQQILAIDPHSRAALSQAAEAYRAKGDTAKAIDTWTMLVSTDPGNTRVVEPVVQQIALSGRAARAIPIINQAVTENPGDPRLLDLQFRLLRAAKDWKGAIKAGEEMVRTDTALADTSYFLRLSDAYANDSQPQKAAETIARGVAKFPANTDLRLYYVQLLRGAGQNQQAAEALRQVIASNPKAPRAYIQLAQLQMELNQADSAYNALHLAKANGDSAALVGQAALLIGNQRYKAANGTKNAADYQNALRFLTYADSNLTDATQKAQSEFLSGVVQLSLGQQALQTARDTKSCDAAKQAQAYFVDAQINLPKGGSFNADATKQALGALSQLSPYADQMAKALKCK